MNPLALLGSSPDAPALDIEAHRATASGNFGHMGPMKRPTLHLAVRDGGAYGPERCLRHGVQFVWHCFTASRDESGVPVRSWAA